MADQELTVLKDFKYRTRMMRAGDDVTMSGPDARLYTALKAVGPRVVNPVRGGSTMIAHEPSVKPAPKPAAKPARKRKAAAKKK